MILKSGGMDNDLDNRKLIISAEIIDRLREKAIGFTIQMNYLYKVVRQSKV